MFLHNLNKDTTFKIKENSKMKSLLVANPNLVRFCVFKSFLLCLLFTSSQCLGASPPLQNVSVSHTPSGSSYIVNFSVNDPTRGVISANSGVIDLISYNNSHGVVFWNYWIRNPDLSLSKMVGFSVYDPKTGVWNTRTTVGIDTDVISGVACDGGTVLWLGFGGIVRFAMFDSELNGWVISSSSNFTNAAFVDATGAVAWQSGNNYYVTVYDPTRRSFRIGATPSLTIPSSYSIGNGTLSYTSGGVGATLGYRPSTGGWSGGSSTTPLAYFIPSKVTGNVPLTIFFWDMSIGSTGWSYNFGDGGGSSVANPTYTYNSAAGTPYTASLSVSGPGGNSSYNRVITPTTPHSISGTVANANGFKIPNAAVSLTGALTKNTTTDNNGNYSFVNLTANGNYTVTITKAEYTFVPPTRSYTNLTGAQSGNFTGKLNDKPSDFDGDGKSDASIFRPSNSYWWVLNSSNNAAVPTYFGLSGDKVSPRDFDGDGKADVAVFRPSDGNWYILQSSNNVYTGKHWGQSGDIPVAGDYDGDDKADVAVFRPSDGTWYLLKSSNSQPYQIQFGLGTDKVATGDYDGDEKGDFAVFRQSDSTWYILRSSDQGITIQTFGNSEDKPVQGDYDGDGKTDFATFRPSDCIWRIKRSSDGVTTAQNWGLIDDFLTPGDFDGDGKTDVGVFRPSNGTWYVIRSSDQGWYTPGFGTNGDYPTLQSYLAE
jgi:hypothetical protein